MNRVCCLQFARLASSRLPNKLLHAIAGERLIDRGCRYLKAMEKRTGVVPILATPDAELITAARDAGIEAIVLDEQAARARIWPELIQPYVGLLADRFDVVWDANVLCRPFLRPETGDFIASQCLETQRPFVAVVRRRGIIWSETSPVPVIGAGELADTRNNPHFFEPSHLAYVWPACMLPLPEESLAQEVVPLEIRLDWKERIDIDTPEDLQAANAIARLDQHAFGGIALGTGPSLRPWVAAGAFPAVPKYGCSFVPSLLKIDVYCYCDPVHAADLPADGTPIIATERVHSAGMRRWCEDFHHAGGSGGMAISEACKQHDCVALIGFDGGMDAEHDQLLRNLLLWWKEQFGRKFVSLMPPGTILDDLCEPARP